MEGYRKASCPQFPECDGCKLFHGCLYGQGRWEDSWYISTSYKLKELLCPVYKQYHKATVEDDVDAYRQAIIAATGKMLTEHMLPAAELMHRADIAAIILDELKRRGEYEKPKEAMRI